LVVTKTAYKARWIIDGVRDSEIADGILVVEDGNVVSVGGGQPPSDAQLIDLGNATLLPGLIDCHVHLPFDASADPVDVLARQSIPYGTMMAYKHAQIVLQSGVTTVRDVSSPHGITLGLRDAIAAGVVTGPRILSAGTHISITGGHGSVFGVEADGPQELRKAVREQLKAGADFIKLMETGGVYSSGLRETPDTVQLLLDEMREAVEVAHRAGRKVAAHAEGSEGIAISLEAGVDTIEHGNHLTEELAKVMVKQGAFLVPTVSAFRAVVASNDVPAEYRRAAATLVDASKNCLRIAKQFGVNVATGTDSGTAMNMPWTGNYLVEEIKFLVELGGFTPMEAVKSATIVSARALNIDSIVGTLQEGKLADVIAVKGNALESLDSLAKPFLVVRSGLPLYQDLAASEVARVASRV
jgi:imidazolonepropionase-like amidohydrolase